MSPGPIATSRRRASSRRHGPGSLAHVTIADIEAVAGIGSYALDIASGRWTSSSGLDAILGIDAAYDHTVEGWGRLVHPDDGPAMMAYFAEEVLGRRTAFDRAYRIVRPCDRRVRWVHGRGRLELDASGSPTAMLGTIADVTEAREAHLALASSEARYAAVFDGAIEAILIADAETLRFLYANRAASTLLGRSHDEILANRVPDIHPADSRTPIVDHLRDLLRGGGGIDRNVPLVRADGSVRLADVRVTATEIEGRPCAIGFFSDVTEARALEAEKARLAAAVEGSSDSVVITDLAGTIQYVNPAFERTTGYTRAEAIGQNPRMLKSGRQSRAFYRAMWRRLVARRPWSGTLLNRRMDGTLFEEEATISPIVQDGVPTGYIAVKRDVTHLRAVESALSREVRERATIRAGLAAISPGPTPAATAAALVDLLVRGPGIDAAVIFEFPLGEQVRTLAVEGPAGIPQAVGAALPPARAAYLRARASQGPWAEAWRTRSEDGAYGEAMASLGLAALAYAPIVSDGRVLGLVAAATTDAAYGRRLVEQMPGVAEVAATASALLGRELAAVHDLDRIRDRVAAIIAGSAYVVAFQPIVRLADGSVAGYEALTRFADGVDPAARFSEAAGAGVGVELELACIARALEDTRYLPPDAWVSVNASPDTILRLGELGAKLAAARRRIVVELTEHVRVPDYDAVRRAASAARVELAVDDTGAGFASMRHVLELRPRFVKLDYSLVHNVHEDPARQAMLAGLEAFAHRAGCELIAEGIEAPGELRLLCEAGIGLGQGFLLGVPRPVSATAPSGTRTARRRLPSCAGVAVS
ncbi:MAG TPA: PAS domain S-box protein [Candidatus Dormibacteraeota bacterium]|nr:PAS domain S-box protein [Candidatus Dormibacteraeota bacterium]